MKKLFIFTIMIVLVIFIAKIGIELYLKNNFKADAQEFLSELLDTEVSFEKISINIFSDIQIHNIKIKEPGTDRLFFSVNKIYCSYDLSALLKKKIQISELTIDNPIINVIRFENNRFNFEKFKNLSKLPLYQKSNYIYASEIKKKNNTDFSKYLNISKISLYDLMLVFDDKLSNKKLETGNINIKGSINPIKFDINGELFFKEKISGNISLINEKPDIDFNIKNINVQNYFFLIKDKINSMPLDINHSVLDVDFSLKDKIENIECDVKILKLNTNINEIVIDIKDQNIFYKNKDVILDDFKFNIYKNNILITSSILKGSILNFENVDAKLNGKVLNNDFMRLFDLDKQSLKTSDFDYSGNILGNVVKNDLKAKFNATIPVLEYAFFSEDNKKIMFPVNSLNLDADLINDKIDLKCNGNIFDGTVEVIGDLLINKDLDMNVFFKANSLNGQKFLEVNNMNKIPVYGEVYADFDLKGQKFAVSSFAGTGEVVVTKAFFDTLGINKILNKSHSKTIKKASMKDIKAKVYLKDEKFSFGNISGIGDDFNFNGGGTVGLDMNMDFKLNMDILKPFIIKNDLEKFLTPEDDFILELKGTLTEPDIKTNLDDMFKEKLKDKFEEKYKEDIDKIKDKAKEFFKKLF